MPITEKNAARLKFLTENLIRMLAASHRAAGQHVEGDCAVCKVLEKSQRSLDEILDRRRSGRVAYLTGVAGDSPTTGRFVTRLSDLSASGAFLDSVSGFPEGTCFHLKFRLGERRITVACQVAYTIEHIGMGVRFLDLNAEDAQAIEAFVAAGAPTGR